MSRSFHCRCHEVPRWKNKVGHLSRVAIIARHVAALSGEDYARSRSCAPALRRSFRNVAGVSSCDVWREECGVEECDEVLC